MRDVATKGNGLGGRRLPWRFAATSLVLIAGTAVYHGCGTEQPNVPDEKLAKVEFTHAGHIDNGCTECHESDRPAAAADGTLHGDGKDCVGCHSSSDSQGSWLPAHPFTHDPAPTTCLPCHTKERPVPPHAATGDCAGCHKFPKWL